MNITIIKKSRLHWPGITIIVLMTALTTFLTGSVVECFGQEKKPKHRIAVMEPRAILDYDAFNVDERIVFNNGKVDLFLHSETLKGYVPTNNWSQPTKKPLPQVRLRQGKLEVKLPVGTFIPAAIIDTVKNVMYPQNKGVTTRFE